MNAFAKFWAIFMTLVVIAAAILAGVWFSDGTLTYNGGEKKPEKEEETIAYTENGTELGSGDTLPMQNMTFKAAKTLAAGADAQNEEYASVTLTATVTPSWVTAELNWAVSFKNPASEWAMEKTVTDYVTVTPGETTQTATVQCLQPFGEQIVVTVSADGFDDVSATCTVDFQRRLLRMLIYTEDYPEGTDISALEYIDWHTDLEGSETGIDVAYEFSEYTVKGIVSDTPVGAVYGVNMYSGALRTPQDDGISFTATATGNERYPGSPFSVSISDYLWIGHYSSNTLFKDFTTLNTWIYTHCDDEGYCIIFELKISDYSVPIRLSREYFTATVNVALDKTETTI